jgi:putative restriction endonuclease
MVKLYVGITDFDWFQFLSAQLTVDEANFWQPGGRTNFRALEPGELFLFKLHSPRNFILGGGVFARADILPLSLAWDAFGTSNGAPVHRLFDLGYITVSNAGRFEVGAAAQGGFRERPSPL